MWPRNELERFETSGVGSEFAAQRASPEPCEPIENQGPDESAPNEIGDFQKLVNDFQLRALRLAPVFLLLPPSLPARFCERGRSGLIGRNRER